MSKNVLCVIPARGGSKSIRKKNIRELNGKPLIYYTISEALKAFDKKNLVISTDDDEIAKISMDYGCNIYFKRPKKLATDKAQSYEVILHSLKFMEKLFDKKYHSIMMLQPTSPFRTFKHINKSLQMIKSKHIDSVVSVVNVDGYHPYRMKVIKKNYLYNYYEQGFEDMRPRQILPKIFIRNGAIYLNKRDVIVHQKQLVGKKVMPLIMKPKESVNIDSIIDFYVAESLLKKRG
tara:strand:- start:586 stop:1287 length:702 start_codon:yes stop_codon:yes gene_type:complete